MNNSLFFVIPIPLSQPLLYTRLSALGVLRITNQGQVLERALHLSKIAPHTILSPAYLFKQHICPDALERGLTGLKFYATCRKSLNPDDPNDVLVTFSMRHMMSLNALALQNFQQPDVISAFQRILDIKTVLATCHYFGANPIPLIQNLEDAAAYFKFDQPINSQFKRLEALKFIQQSLVMREPKILNFLLRTRQQKTEMLQNSPSPYFVYINEKGRLCLVKMLLLSPDQRYMKALCIYGSNTELITINLELHPLIAPLSIITPERQERLKFNVSEHIQRLENINMDDLVSEQSHYGVVLNQEIGYAKQRIGDHMAEQPSKVTTSLVWHDSDRNFYDRFLLQLPSELQALFKRPLGSPLTSQELGLPIEKHRDLSRLVVYYMYENFPNLRTPQLEQRYKLFANQQYQSRATIIAQECSLIMSDMASYPKNKIDFLNSIIAYFMG